MADERNVEYDSYVPLIKEWETQAWVLKRKHNSDGSMIFWNWLLLIYMD